MLEAHKKNEVVIEKVTKKEIEKKLKKVGILKPWKGHTLFKVNTDTLEIVRAEFVEPDKITFKEAKLGYKVKKKVVMEKGFAYFSALNEKNVHKKISKMVGEKEASKAFYTHGGVVKKFF